MPIHRTIINGRGLRPRAGLPVPATGVLFFAKLTAGSGCRKKGIRFVCVARSHGPQEPRCVTQEEHEHDRGHHDEHGDGQPGPAF